MHVAILGLGPSVDTYTDFAKRMGGRHKVADEVWAINALGSVFDCDLIFHMDDVRIQEIRAEAKPESNIAAMLEWMKKTKTPIMTSRKHKDYPSLKEFPYEKVVNKLRYEYFNSTAAYAVAYAVYLGVDQITVFGNDFTYPNSSDAEKGRGCVEFWLGQAAARGIKISLPHTTTLMDALHPRSERVYGYDTWEPVLTMKEDGEIKVKFKEIETLPTAEEVEAKYDHSKHPNALMVEVEDE